MIEEYPFHHSRSESYVAAGAFTAGEAFPSSQAMYPPLLAPRDRLPRDCPVTDLFGYQVLKRVADILLVLLALPLLVPLLAVLSFLLWITSPDPVFYSHRRIGRNAEAFSMWKFRTMCVDSTAVLERYLAQNPAARSEWQRTHKLRKDPRVTKLGAFLRRFSLDELPQLWNVLAGEMSLVGPRPIVSAEVQKYGDCFLCYCHVKPGITGLWQVSGRSTLRYDQRVCLDCDYVHHWSLLLDLRILLRTFSCVVNQDGAF
jgi:lipopolysaccharide/colanic/teichoic acid biosynthesis glycosyltransferase